MTASGRFEEESRGKALRFVRRCNEGDVFLVGSCGIHLRRDDCADGTTSLRRLTKQKLAAIAISSFAADAQS